MLNLEVKTRDPNPAATLDACARLAAVDRGSLRQRDTYFDVRAGRLKLREELQSGSAELIYYERPTAEGVRASRYWRIDVAAPEELRDVLGLTLGIRGVVDKKRRLFLFEHVRIHLDDVEGLGTFVELEAVLPEDAAPPEGQDEVLVRVIDALGLRERESIAGGYLELLESRS